MSSFDADARSPATFLLQMPSTHETRTVRMAAMLLDGYQVANATLGRTMEHKEGLMSGSFVPVGSVEFVREAMQTAELHEPTFNPYVEVMKPWFKRSIQKRQAGAILDAVFVKPVTTKLFNGFVFDPLGDPSSLDEYDQEQHAVFMALPADTEVWVSEPVKFVSEWRYYVNENGIVGAARYDDGADDALEPNAEDVSAAATLALRALGHGFALDMGVLDSGETALVEINDAWAIGLYGKSLSPVVYASWLRQRWESIKAAPKA